MTADNQGPSYLAPNSFDADHPGADGLLIRKCNRCHRKLYVASGRLSIMAFQIWREWPCHSLVRRSILPRRLSFQFSDGTDAERGCRQWTLTQDS